MVRCFSDARELASFFQQESAKQREACENCRLPDGACPLRLFWSNQLLEAAEVCSSPGFSGKHPKVFAALGACANIRFCPQPAI